MKYNAGWKNGYKEVVEYAVITALENLEEGGGFSLREFADGYGFKITPNLRRRITELCTEGKLARAERYLNNGKLGYFYFAPATFAQHLMPEEGEYNRWEDAEPQTPAADDFETFETRAGDGTPYMSMRRRGQ